MVRYFFTFLFFAFSFTLYAQSGEVFGIIRDQATEEPIPFANVFFKSNQKRGVISNENGEFSIKIGLEDGQDSLVFSELGYEPVFIALSDVSTDTLFVLMEEQSLPLPQVTVFSDEKLRQIVREALSRLPEQYGNPKTFMPAYYREYSITDTAYSEMIEAFVTIKDGRFFYPPREPDIFLKELRRSLDRRDIPEEIKQGYDNGIYNICERFPYVMSRVFNLFDRRQESFLNQYRFFNNGEFLEGKDTLIAIGFIFSEASVLNAKGIDAPYRMGEMVIRKSDFGILKLRQGNPEKDSYSEIVYQKKDGKYYPSRIQLVYSFQFDRNRRFYLNSRQLHILQIVPNENLKKSRIKKGRFLRPELNLREINYSYNEKFWEENRMLVRIPAPEALRVDLTKRGSLQDQFYQTSRGKKK